jgi:hypothetical protein
LLAQHPRRVKWHEWCLWLVAGLAAGALWLLVMAGGAFALSGDANRGVGECQAAAEVSPGYTALPDCRRYELVTPAQKNGALIGTAAFVLPAEVAADGSRLMAVSLQCLPGSLSCDPNRLPNEGDPYELERTPGGGWVMRALAPSASELPADSYYGLNVETGTALFSAPGPPVGQDDFYARAPGGAFTDVGPVGEAPGDSNGEIRPSEYVATANLLHVVYQTKNPLWAFDETESGFEALYEYAGTEKTAEAEGTLPRLLLVGVEGGEGSTWLVSECGTGLPGDRETARQDETLSGDGRIAYFSAAGQRVCGRRAPTVSELWARIDGERADAHSVLVSAATAAACTSPACLENTSDVKTVEEERGREPLFEAASGSGERVFFTDAQQLTDAASETGTAGTVSEGEGNLYESECPGLCPDAVVERRLVDVSDPGAGAEPIENGPRVQGVMAISADGSSVYFVAQGELTKEPNLYGEAAVEGEDNLYLYTEGRLTFIAALSPSDNQSEQWESEEGGQANVTPDGQFLVFTDDRALTGDDTRPAGDAEGAAQVYEYDAATRALTRVSVGARGVYQCPANGLLQEGYNCDGNTGTGNAYIARAQRGGAAMSTVPVRRDPSMSEDGALVFFESPIALTAGALNDVQIGKEGGVVRYAQNVYEYYRGEVYLISDGKDATGQSHVTEYPGPGAPNGLIGVDPSGTNVFFSTFDSLTGEDTDTERDYYDARACSEERRGVEEACAPPAAEEAAACAEQAACQLPAGAPPVAGVAGSEAFSGPGNLVVAPVAVVKPAVVLSRGEKLARALKVCRAKKREHVRAVCEAVARRRYGPAAKKTTAAMKAAAMSGRGGGV